MNEAMKNLILDIRENADSAGSSDDLNDYGFYASRAVKAALALADLVEGQRPA